MHTCTVFQMKRRNKWLFNILLVIFEPLSLHVRELQWVTINNSNHISRLSVLVGTPLCIQGLTSKLKAGGRIGPIYVIFDVPCGSHKFRQLVWLQG